MSEDAWALVVLGAAAAALTLAALVPKPEPIRADPQPTAICELNEDTITADGTMEWPADSHAPCKWFKKEQDV